MILWWGRKKQPDPKTGETPIEPLKPGETPASALDKPVASLDQQLFGNVPIAAEPDLGDDPLGIRIQLVVEDDRRTGREQAHGGKEQLGALDYGVPE
jgi:hypothetical protein